MNIIHSAAADWSVSDDGLSRTFKLRGGQVWSDGGPVAANDPVESWRYMADPEHGCDFVWLWQDILDGWDEIVAGEIPPEEQSRVAVDDNTLAASTQKSFPPLQAKALDRELIARICTETCQLGLYTIWFSFDLSIAQGIIARHILPNALTPPLLSSPLLCPWPYSPRPV